MRTFSKARLRTYWMRNATSEGPLSDWFALTEKAEWNSFSDVKNTFASADQVGRNVIFNVGGNNYRLVAHVVYKVQSVYILWVGTHAEYDRLTKEEIKNL